MSSRRNLSLGLLSAVVLLIGLPGRASATVVFNNFGPGDTYQNYGTWFGHRPGLDSWSIDAIAITPGTSGWMQDLTMGMWTSDPNNEFVLSLRADASGKPGSSVWSRTFIGALGGYGSVAHLNNVGGPFLLAGNRYWLVADTLNNATQHQWYTGFGSATNTTARMSPPSNGDWWVSNNTVGWSTRVETFVPEPSFALTALAISFLPLRRRRSGVRVTSTAR